MAFFYHFKRSTKAPPRSPYHQRAVAAFLMPELQGSYWNPQMSSTYGRLRPPCEFCDTILAPHFEGVKVKLGLLHAQCSLWLIDCGQCIDPRNFLHGWSSITRPSLSFLFRQDVWAFSSRAMSDSAYIQALFEGLRHIPTFFKRC